MFCYLKIVVALVSFCLIVVAIYKAYIAYKRYSSEIDKQNSDKVLIKKLRNKKNKAILIWAPICICSLWVFSWMLIDLWYKHGTGDSVGTFGDKFGAINALFSGLAFAGLIMTLVLQKEELEAQREELKQTREELEGQKKEFEIQNKTLKQQQFSTTFFQLLNAVQKNIDNVEVIALDYCLNPSRPQKGECCFRDVAYAIKEFIKRIMEEEENNVTLKEKAVYEYERLYKKSLYPMGVFFRSYYRLIKYIITSDLDDKEKYQYVSFARAQLSDDVISVLFYNLTIGYGREKFKKLAEDWVLLKNIPEKIFIYDEMKGWISEKAYKRGDRYGAAEEKE